MDGQYKFILLLQHKFLLKIALFPNMHSMKEMNFGCILHFLKSSTVEKKSYFKYRVDH